MSLFVKICGLNSQDDVNVAVAAGADAVGFVFAESVRKVSPDQAMHASRDLSPGVLRVAVMRHPSAAEWQAVLEGFAPDVLQTDAEDFDALEVPESVSRWPVFREGGERAPGNDDVYLYEGKTSGSGTAIDWQQAAKVAMRGRMMLAGGLSASNVGDAVRTVRPWGVDVSSGVESSPGRKDPDKIQAFIKAARAAETMI